MLITILITLTSQWLLPIIFCVNWYQWVVLTMGPCILLRFSLDKNDMLLTKRRNSSGALWRKPHPKIGKYSKRRAFQSLMIIERLWLQKILVCWSTTKRLYVVHCYRKDVVKLTHSHKSYCLLPSKYATEGLEPRNFIEPSLFIWSTFMQ